MKKLTLVLLLLIASDVISQVSDTKNWQIPNNVDLEETPPVVLKSCKPNFPGGAVALLNYVKSTAYFPERAYQQGLEGTVYVQTYIMPNGAIEILGTKGKLGGGCDEEAKRIVEAMPCWEPALQASVPVKCKMTIPVVFKYM